MLVTAQATDNISSDQLSEFARTANENHALAVTTASHALDLAKTVGETLIAVKGRLPHGQFEDWIRGNCHFSVQTAGRYLSVARRWNVISEHRQENPQLTMAESLALTSKPRPNLSSTRDLDEESLDIPKVSPQSAAKIAEVCSILNGYNRGDNTDAGANENIADWINRADWGRFDAEILLPEVGESICGKHDTGYVVIESHWDNRYVRIGVICGDMIEFTGRGFVRALAGIWLMMAGVNTASLQWCDPLPATAENNPMAKLIPEWKYAA